ncbi:MAG: Hpt domain-containing protein [Flavobacteriales bacterium]|jgi:HPt (histidine-containing phosphotransfer) domain-containing protein|nr:Hpt domain-containing protein [Flavobacteriales bacterium]
MENLIDLTLLEELANGDVGLLNKMKSIFIEETTLNIKKIEQNLEEENFVRISEIAHSIKPSLDYMAVVQMRNQVRTIEKQDFTNDDAIENVTSFIGDLKSLVNQLS